MNFSYHIWIIIYLHISKFTEINVVTFCLSVRLASKIDSVDSDV